METTITTDKNNFICGGQHARRFRSAAKFRGEKEDNVDSLYFCIIEDLGCVAQRQYKVDRRGCMCLLVGGLSVF